MTPPAIAAAPAEIAEREASRGQIGADRLDCCKHSQRIGHPMLARLADGVGEVAAEQTGGNQAAAILGSHGVGRGDVCVTAAEGDDLLGMAPGRAE